MRLGGCEGLLPVPESTWIARKLDALVGGMAVIGF